MPVLFFPVLTILKYVLNGMDEALLGEHAENILETSRKRWRRGGLKIKKNAFVLFPGINILDNYFLFISQLVLNLVIYFPEANGVNVSRH